MQLTPLKAGNRAEGIGLIVRIVERFWVKYEDPHPGGTPSLILIASPCPPEVFDQITKLLEGRHPSKRTSRPP